MEPSLSTGRRDHTDGGLLHPDALRHDHAAPGHQPGGPQYGASDVPEWPRRRPARRPLLMRATCCASPPSTARRTCGSTARPARSKQARKPTSSSSTPTAINVAPINNVPGAVVTLMDRTNVETVIVAGKVRKWKGQLLDVDLDAAAPPARILARLYLRRSGRSAESVPQQLRRAHERHRSTARWSFNSLKLRPSKTCRYGYPVFRKHITWWSFMPGIHCPGAITSLEGFLFNRAPHQLKELFAMIL